MISAASACHTEHEILRENMKGGSTRNCHFQIHLKTESLSSVAKPPHQSSFIVFVICRFIDYYTTVTCSGFSQVFDHIFFYIFSDTKSVFPPSPPVMLADHHSSSESRKDWYLFLKFSTENKSSWCVFFSQSTKKSCNYSKDVKVENTLKLWAKGYIWGQNFR